MRYSVKITMPSKSSNSKVGNIPTTTTSNVTCPDACPLKSSGCYAEGGPLGYIWRNISAAKPGDTFAKGRHTLRTNTWAELLTAVATFPDDQLWRHNQAGDLPGVSDQIDVGALASLVDANVGRKGFTYTHKPIVGDHGASNAKAIADANARGFTVNLSANNLADADRLADADIAPVVVVLSADVHGNEKIKTPAGRVVSVCPATYRDDVTCASCGLCQRQERKSIVGFPAHGVSKRKATAIALS